MRPRALVECLGFVLTASFVLLTEPASAQCPSPVSSYALLDLGTLGGTTSFALAIDARGRVVGGADPASGCQHPFLYQNGAMTDLGTLGGCAGLAGDINPSGQIVGQADNADDIRRAFLYGDGGMSEIGTLGGWDSRAFALNDSGQIVGISNPAGSGFQHAFLYSNGTMTDLGTLSLGDNTSYANGINASGQIAGWSGPSNGVSAAQAYLYTNPAMVPLGTLGGTRSVAFALNDAGQVVGWSDVAGDASFHAFLYDGGAMADLGTLGGDFSLASGLDEFGHVVGWADTSAGRQHAFIYSGGLMQDFNDLIPSGSGFELVYAAAINEAGQIVGWGTTGGRTHAFRLTPAPAMIDDLIDLARSFSLPKGTENSLIVKLQSALRSLAGCNPSSACAELGAFVNEVNAQAGKKLTASQAAELLRIVNQIRATLGCP